MKKICVLLILMSLIVQAAAYQIVPETPVERATRMGASCMLVATIVVDIVTDRSAYKKTHNGADLSMSQFLKMYDSKPLRIPDNIGPNKPWWSAVARPVAKTYYTTEMADMELNTAFNLMRTICLLDPNTYFTASQMVK
jgi:hypothetical protein